MLMSRSCQPNELRKGPRRGYRCSAASEEFNAMDMIKYATICAAAAASLTACGGGVSHDAATTGQSVAPLATSESASPCSSATADVLKSATQREYGQPGKALDGPFTVEKVLCSGEWAKTLIDVEA